MGGDGRIKPPQWNFYNQRQLPLAMWLPPPGRRRRRVAAAAGPPPLGRRVAAGPSNNLFGRTWVTMGELNPQYFFYLFIYLFIYLFLFYFYFLFIYFLFYFLFIYFLFIFIYLFIYFFNFYNQRWRRLSRDVVVKDVLSLLGVAAEPLNSVFGHHGRVSVVKVMYIGIIKLPAFNK